MPRNEYDIREYGAVADGTTLNTDAIQSAVDACTEAGGGRVVVPPGTYLTGTVHLKDNVSLHLSAGAVLLGSPRVEDYTPAGVVMAQGAHSIAITGHGAIDGNGPSFWLPKDDEVVRANPRQRFGWVPQIAFRHPDRRPGKMIRLIDCQGVRVQDVELRNAESWTLFVLGCQDVNVRGVRMLNPLHGPNTDGLDLVASSQVTVSDCYIYTGDDAICLKNEEPEFAHRPCRDITITNCVLITTCNAFKIGTGTHGDFQNIVVSNCVMRAGKPLEPLSQVSAGTYGPDHYGNALGPLAGIAIETVDGGDVRGVAVTNITMEGARAPIFIRRANRASLQDPAAEPGILEGVSISNVVAYGASTTSSITGLPGYPVRDVTLSNVRIRTQGGADARWAQRELDEMAVDYPESVMWGPLPAYGLYCRHVAGLVGREITVAVEEPDGRPLLVCDDVADLRLDGFRAYGRATAGNLIELRNVRDAILRGTSPPEGTLTWVRVSGSETEGIVLKPDDLRHVQEPLSISNEAPARTVRLIRP